MHGYQTRLVILVLLLIIANAAGWTISIRQAREPAVDLDMMAIPMNFDGWQGTDVPQPKAVLRALAGDALLRRTYKRNDVTIDFWAVFGRDWRDLHSPEGCYLAGGWTIIGGRNVDVPASGKPHREIHGRLFEARKNGEKLVALYLFATKQGTMPDRARLGWSLLKPGDDSYGLLIHAATIADDGETRAAAEVTEFTQAIYPIVARLLVPSEAGVGK